jgi:hypothetical protein
MQEFPFSAEEWQEVSEASRALTNATLMDDEILQAAKFAELQIVFTELRDRYGEHPVLLETEADFTDSPDESISLYERAEKLAIEHRLPTYSIRLSLAGVLLRDLAQSALARAKLLQCHEELLALGDKWDQGTWLELMAECEHSSGNAERN